MPVIIELVEIIAERSRLLHTIEYIKHMATNRVMRENKKGGMNNEAKKY